MSGDSVDTPAGKFAPWPAALLAGSGQYFRASLGILGTKDEISQRIWGWTLQNEGGRDVTTRQNFNWRISSDIWIQVIL